MADEKPDPKPESEEEESLENADLELMSGGDRPTEEVAFYYNKIAFGYTTTTDGKTAQHTPPISNKR